jgi:hypothetical protein
MSSSFYDRGRFVAAGSIPKPSFVPEAAPAARAGAGARQACAAQEADFLIQVAEALVELRTAIARWRATAHGGLRALRRAEMERHQDALVAVLWGASRARLGREEWRVVERLLGAEPGSPKVRRGGCATAEACA